MKRLISALFATLLIFTMPLVAYATDSGEAETTLTASEIQAIAEAQAAQAAEAAAIQAAQAQAIQAAQAAEAAQAQTLQEQALQEQNQALPIGTPAHLVVHRISNILGVYDQNWQPIKVCPVSTGRAGHLTPLGTYSIYQHSTGAGYHLMVDGTYGRYCMRFKQGGYMFHSVCYAYPGAPTPIPEEVLALGTSVSRGCIRLSVADAEWLYHATPNGCEVSILDD